MPLDRSQLVRLHLAGSVALPSPYPTIGKISRDADPIAYNHSSGSAGHVFYVSHDDGGGRAVTWCVCSSDIVAFEEKRNVAADSTWHLGPEALDAIEADEATSGILYVRETAQILLRTETGLSALDSVDVQVVSGGVGRSPSTARADSPAVRAQRCLC